MREVPSIKKHFRVWAIVVFAVLAAGYFYLFYADDPAIDSRIKKFIRDEKKQEEILSPKSAELLIVADVYKRQGHGNYAPFVFEIITMTVGGELSLDTVTRPTHPGAFRAAALDHKLRNDPVESKPVIKTALDERDKVIYRIRGNGRLQLDLDLASALHLYRHHGFFHFFRFLSLFLPGGYPAIDIPLFPVSYTHLNFRIEG